MSAPQEGYYHSKFYRKMTPREAIQVMFAARRAYLSNELNHNLRARDTRDNLITNPKFHESNAYSELRHALSKARKLRVADFLREWDERTKSFIELGLDHYMSCQFQQLGLDDSLEFAMEQTYFDTCGFRVAEAAS